MPNLIKWLLALACCLGFITQLSAHSINEHGGNVRVGSQVLRSTGFNALRGHRVAILSNPTGVFPDTLDHIVDVTAGLDYLDVVAIFGPEHGFRGELQAETGDPLVYTDAATGLPVFSVYKMSNEAIEALIIDMNITMVLVDMQDVGVRLYTFIWTMYNVLESAILASSQSGHPIGIHVCDRPNPLGGLLVDGPMLNMSCCTSGYGKAEITHIHGMTISELSLLFNEQLRNKYATQDDNRFQLQVVKMENWSRGMSWRDTGLPWVPPSPNVPTVATAVAYGATCFLEATTVAEGRGTTTPFELFGAPFLSSSEYASSLNQLFECPQSQSCFRGAYFQPTFSKYNNTAVPGVQWLHERLNLNSRSNNQCDGLNSMMQLPSCTLFESAIRILSISMSLSNPPESFQWDGSWFGHPGTELIDSYAGTPQLREMLNAGFSIERIVSHFKSDSEMFKVMREKFLLY